MSEEDLSAYEVVVDFTDFKTSPLGCHIRELLKGGINSTIEELGVDIISSGRGAVMIYLHIIGPLLKVLKILDIMESTANPRAAVELGRIRRELAISDRVIYTELDRE